jgi:hypothetical protein
MALENGYDARYPAWASMVNNGIVKPNGYLKQKKKNNRTT